MVSYNKKGSLETRANWISPSKLSNIEGATTNQVMQATLETTNYVVLCIHLGYNIIRRSCAYIWVIILMVNERHRNLHFFRVFTLPTFNGLSREISNWCLSPSGKITTRVSSSDLSLFVGGGFVASSGSGCGWNKNSQIINVLPFIHYWI